MLFKAKNGYHKGLTLEIDEVSRISMAMSIMDLKEEDMDTLISKCNMDFIDNLIFEVYSAQGMVEYYKVVGSKDFEEITVSITL